MWRCDNVGGLGEHVKKNMCCGFLGIPFFTLFFGSRRARKCGPILTIYRYDVFPPKNVPFGVSFILLSILGAKSPKNLNFGGVNRHFQA